MIELSRVSKEYSSGHRALCDLSLRVAQGTTLAILGPSGCGKTTTLRLINRLLEPSSGTIRVAGRDISENDPILLRRSVGYVVQEAGLFPHLSAQANIEIVPTLLGWNAEQKRRRSRELLEWMDLDSPEIATRYPAQLSGGQRQRVGIARALAADPPIVLMDEPFGALDPLTRRHLQEHFLALSRRLSKTVVLVTHDVSEAFFLADFVAILDRGQLVQYGSPAAIRENPATALVADFLSTTQPPAAQPAGSATQRGSGR